MKPLPGKSLLALMIVSQVLLTAFVVQWLVSQYRNERLELKKELTWQFDKSQHDVLDSLLEKNLIGPLLNNKNGFKISMHDADVDPLRDRGKIKMLVEKNTTSDSTELITVVTKDNGRTETVDVHDKAEEDLLMHGVRLIVKEVTSDSHNQEFEKKIYAGSDSLLLRHVVSEHLSGNGWKFTARLVHESGDSTSFQGGKGIYLESSVFPEKYGLEIGGYHFYLLKKIFPQSVFALILLLLTGLAFLLAYRTLKNQVRLNAMKNDFIDNISHELKTPLSTVKVVVEALRDENIRKDEKTTKEYLEMAAMEIGRLELLTGKVLSTSMIENGIVQMQKQKIDLLGLVRGLVYTLKVRLANEKAALTIDAADENYFVDGDELHIQGALLNLIDNALKYSRSNAEITMTLEKSPGEIILRVKDNGPGIPEEYLGKIFEKFFRVPSGNLHNVKGHGLGLSYVFMVMKIHGGSVRVENDPAGGSIFILKFPAA